MAREGAEEGPLSTPTANKPADHRYKRYPSPRGLSGRPVSVGRKQTGPDYLPAYAVFAVFAVFDIIVQDRRP